MQLFENIIITGIEAPIIVHSKKGLKIKMTDRESYGLSFCIQGQITYTMNGKTYISDPNHVVFLPQNGNYSIYGNKEGFFPVINFKCENFNCDSIMVLPLQNSRSYIKDFEKIKNLFLFKENKLKIFSVFYELLNKISKEQLPQQNPLHSAIRYLENNISDPQLTNIELARQAKISEVYLRKLFLAHYNTTPKQYILDIRIQKAKQLLADSHFTVTSISEECGFSSLYHFCRAFKEKTGLTPTQYAKQNKTFQI